jgi:ribonuclease PH
MERSGGRRQHEMRPVVFERDYIEYPEGSVLVAMGRTKVLCNVTVETGVPGWMTDSRAAGGWLTAEYALLPRSTHSRVSRETLRPRGRTQEIRRLIGRSLRAALNLADLPPVTITVDCDVLQADGGTRTASITGGYVALALALGRAVSSGEMGPAIFRPPVAAISAGVVDGAVLLDLDYAEDSVADVDANVVMNAAGEFIEVQCTAEGDALTHAQLDEILKLSDDGIQQLLAAQQAALAEADQPLP